MKNCRPTYLFLIASVIIALSGCDSGLQPPPVEEETPPTGAISGTVTYSGQWPPENELREIFFVPLTFMPAQITEVLSQYIAGNLYPSERLETNIESGTFFVSDLPNGAYIYNIIANQFGPIVFSDWRALGVYEDNDGVIIIEGDTVNVSIHVDFDNLPPFPPE